MSHDAAYLLLIHSVHEAAFFYTFLRYVLKYCVCHRSNKVFTLDTEKIKLLNYLEHATIE